MSYNGRSFKKLPPQHASQAARHANAMIKQGVDKQAAIKHARWWTRQKASRMRACAPFRVIVARYHDSSAKA